MASKSIEKVQRMVAGRMDLPVMPPIAGAVMEECTNPKSNASRLAELIGHDPGLMARILRVANSPMYRGRVATTTLEAAIVRLGRGLVRDLVISLSTQSLFRRFDEIERQMWEHSIAVGIAAQTIAKDTRKTDSGEAFVAGLLHDVGKVVLDNSNNQRFRAAAKRAVTEADMTPSRSEKLAFSFHHGEVGGVLLGRWGIAANISDAVFWHHDLAGNDIEHPKSLPGKTRSLLYVLALADEIVGSMAITVGGKVYPIDATQSLAVAGLKLKPAKISGLIESIEEAYERDREIFGG